MVRARDATLGQDVSFSWVGQGSPLKKKGGLADCADYPKRGTGWASSWAMMGKLVLVHYGLGCKIKA
ncbi:hypothetical protein PanWU01x14_065550 [Parasponia andersonii]|uniref:Uncharacterized protein n=1 Tax=Parasponia andersonii TaxID=3476 RepID=A0A2P5DGV1_PARAD|nr:hypothetical protein PanWU01x14_065550 [Parasponia andersonii]